MKTNQLKRLKAGMDSGFPSPSMDTHRTGYADNTSRTLFAADDDSVIAPTTSFKEKNEKDLEKQQDQRADQDTKNNPSKVMSRIIARLKSTSK